MNKRIAETLSENDAFMLTLAQQERARRKQQVAAGLLITGEDLAARLGVSATLVDSFKQNGAFFCFEGSSGERLFPAFYADQEIPLAQLEAVTHALGIVPSSAKWQFFTQARMSLAMRDPLRALKDGDFHAVVVSATAFAER
jgi:hypothetical protein